MGEMRERLLSDQNIYLSIYLLNSYILNHELLDNKDRNEIGFLKDVFNIDKIGKAIAKVKNRLEKIIDDRHPEYFEATVYFKPKKYVDRKISYRPLHTASLIDQMAMVAMLQVLIYDINKNTNKLMPSELSRLLPSNFYGNRISFDGEHLFRTWQEQYRKYTSKANDLLYNYSDTMEYNYEVSLDLEGQVHFVV